MRGATDHPLAVGESVVEDFIVAGNRGTATWTVVARESPVRWSIEGRNVGSNGGGTVTYALAPEGGGTRFTRVLTYHMPNLLAGILNEFGVRERVAAESSEAVARESRAGGKPGYCPSTLIPASLMSFAYFAVSDFMNETNCSGVL